jgi:hypothetical protein
LVLSELLKNRISVIMGSRDSSKTRTVSKWALCDYWCFPEETLFLMTSTDTRGLEMRVWGDIKGLHETARGRYPWLAGNVVDAKHGVFTDDLSEDAESRDMRRGIIGIPCLSSQGEYMGMALKNFCFGGGTMVDTPDGPFRIEFLSPGDVVYSAVGASLILSTSCRIAPSLVRLHLSDGTHIDCTPNHRFLTESGWKNASCILPQDVLVSTHDAMQILREGIRALFPESSLLLPEVHVFGASEAMRTMQERIRPGPSARSVLFSQLFGEMEMESAGDPEAYNLWDAFGEHRDRKEDKPGDSSELCGSPAAPGADDPVAAKLETPSCGETNRSSLRGAWSEPHPYPSRETLVWYLSRVVSRFLHSHGEKLEAWEFSNVLARLGMAVAQAGRGDRRVLPPFGDPDEEGCNPRIMAAASRVDRVEVLGSSGAKSYRNGARGYRVYNLEVEGHPSYSVNGLLAHNCGIKQKRRRLVGDELQFLPQDYLKVLDSLDKGDFKAALLGNPIADNGKALDKVSEPKSGWDSLGEVTKTMTWENKYNGITVNLVGIDSPNFDKETPNWYSYMVDQGDVDRVSRRPGGKDSIEYWSQIMGVRKAGAVSSRVLTVAEIETCGGFGPNIWMGSGTTKIYSIDAGFGGDPCVRTWLEFGKNVDDQDVIVFGDQKVIPILISSKLTAEEQIASYAKLDCANLGIPSSHVYFDAGMYATLAVQMARIMSPEVNAVNFGGTATNRPVDSETYVFDERTRERRLKTCYEAYSKFVTELWFSVRLLVQCRQARKFPREAAEEFGRREWEYVSQDRFQIETKDDYKLRNSGESPNNADSLVIGVEGARRLGFEIRNLRESAASKPDDDWLQREHEKYRKYVKKTELNYS